MLFETRVVWKSSDGAEQQSVNALCVAAAAGRGLTTRWGISTKLSLRITQHTDCWLQEGISIETHKYTLQFVTKRAKYFCRLHLLHFKFTFLQYVRLHRTQQICISLQPTPQIHTTSHIENVLLLSYYARYVVFYKTCIKKKKSTLKLNQCFNKSNVKSTIIKFQEIRMI